MIFAGFHHTAKLVFVSRRRKAPCQAKRLIAGVDDPVPYTNGKIGRRTGLDPELFAFDNAFAPTPPEKQDFLFLVMYVVGNLTANVHVLHAEREPLGPNAIGADDNPPSPGRLARHPQGLGLSRMKKALLLHHRSLLFALPPIVI